MGLTCQNFVSEKHEDAIAIILLLLSLLKAVLSLCVKITIYFRLANKIIKTYHQNYWIYGLKCTTRQYQSRNLKLPNLSSTAVIDLKFSPDIT